MTDIDESARALRKALHPTQILVGVGYSMGAIVISNYVARSGESCQIDAAMAISGGLDMRQNLRFKRSIRLWQPMLAQGINCPVDNKVFHLFQSHLIPCFTFLSRAKGRLYFKQI